MFLSVSSVIVARIRKSRLFLVARAVEIFIVRVVSFPHPSHLPSIRSCRYICINELTGCERSRDIRAGIPMYIGSDSLV